MLSFCITISLSRVRGTQRHQHQQQQHQQQQQQQQPQHPRQDGYTPDAEMLDADAGGGDGFALFDDDLFNHTRTDSPSAPIAYPAATACFYCHRPNVNGYMLPFPRGLICTECHGAEVHCAHYTKCGNAFVRAEVVFDAAVIGLVEEICSACMADNRLKLDVCVCESRCDINDTHSIVAHATSQRHAPSFVDQMLGYHKTQQNSTAALPTTSTPNRIRPFGATVVPSSPSLRITTTATKKKDSPSSIGSASSSSSLEAKAKIAAELAKKATAAAKKYSDKAIIAMKAAAKAAAKAASDATKQGEKESEADETGDEDSDVDGASTTTGSSKKKKKSNTRRERRKIMSKELLNKMRVASGISAVQGKYEEFITKLDKYVKRKLVVGFDVFSDDARKHLSKDEKLYLDGRLWKEATGKQSQWRPTKSVVLADFFNQMLLLKD